MLEGKLHLKVNRDKSRIVNLANNKGQFKYLGFGMYKGRDGFKIVPHVKSRKKFKKKLKAMTNRKRAGKFEDICMELKRVINGWMNYYGIAEMKTWAKEMDGWLRTRMRMIIWKRWKNPRTKYRKLKGLGIPPEYAYMAANTRKGPARAVRLTTVLRALSNRKLEAWGYPSISRSFEHKHQSVVQLRFAF